MRTIHKAIALALTAAALSLASGGVRAQEAHPDIKPGEIEAPEFPAGLKWLNSPPLRMEHLRGKVVLVDFWEYTCINCIRTFPYLKAWHQKYRDLGLVIIGIHTPEFQFAKSEPNVVRAAKRFGLDYPHVVDSDYIVWRTYGNRYWPAKYLIDARGSVRYFHFGEGAYESTEERIQKLLKEHNPEVTLPAITPAIRGTDRKGAVCYPVTPELYLGTERGGHEGTLANPEGYRPGKTVTYRDRGDWEDGTVNVHGAWKNNTEALVSTRPARKPSDYIGIKYHAMEVNSVLKPENGKPVRVWILHDNKPVARKDKGTDIRYDPAGQSYILVDQPRMYNIIKNAVFGQRSLKLAPADAGMGIYSFTFVSCEVAPK